MKLKTIFNALIIGGSILALCSCSAPKGNNSRYANGAYGANGSGAESAGIGDDSSYSSENGGRRNLLMQRTYYFDFDQSAVHDEYKPAIYANADYLMAHPNSKIILEGHTDPRGSREYNVALGERRANAVAEILKDRGVNPSQIRVVSYGAERLATPGHTEEDFQQDRRAVIVRMQG